MSNQNLLDTGPALPPAKMMKVKTRLFGKTKLRIRNENVRPASISVDGVGHFVPPLQESSPGVLDLGTWSFGKTFTILNQSEWVLAIDH